MATQRGWSCSTLPRGSPFLHQLLHALHPSLEKAIHLLPASLWRSPNQVAWRHSKRWTCRVSLCLTPRLRPHPHWRNRVLLVPFTNWKCKAYASMKLLLLLLLLKWLPPSQSLPKHLQTWKWRVQSCNQRPQDSLQQWLNQVPFNHLIMSHLKASNCKRIPPCPSPARLVHFETRTNGKMSSLPAILPCPSQAPTEASKNWISRLSNNPLAHLLLHQWHCPNPAPWVVSKSCKSTSLKRPLLPRSFKTSAPWGPTRYWNLHWRRMWQGKTLSWTKLPWRKSCRPLRTRRPRRWRQSPMIHPLKARRKAAKLLLSQSLPFQTFLPLQAPPLATNPLGVLPVANSPKIWNFPLPAPTEASERWHCSLCPQTRQWMKWKTRASTIAWMDPFSPLQVHLASFSLWNWSILLQSFRRAGWRVAK